MKILAITVGGEPAPVMNAIRSVKPDFCILFASTAPKGGSKRQLLETTEKGPPILEQVGLSEDEFSIVELEDPDDLDLCFQQMVQAMESAAARLSPTQAIADYTGGTKSMAAALVVAALHRGWQLELVTGPRQDLVKVTSGTESAVAVLPSSIRLRELEREAEILFNSHNFAALAGLVEQALQAGNLPSEARNRLQRLLVVTRSFRLWDNFQYKEALEVMRPVASCCPNHAETLARIVGKDVPGYALISDMLGSALRRAQAGLFDDAVLRLYRAVEMLAQIQLRTKHGLDTSALELAKIPEPLRSEFEGRGREKATAGLLDSYRILAAKKDPLGKLFESGWDSRLKDLMGLRNRLLIIHGLEPISKDGWEKAKGITFGFMEEAARALGIKLEPVRFPEFQEVTHWE